MSYNWDENAYRSRVLVAWTEREELPVEAYPEIITCDTERKLLEFLHGEKGRRMRDLLKAHGSVALLLRVPKKWGRQQYYFLCSDGFRVATLRKGQSYSYTNLKKQKWHGVTARDVTEASLINTADYFTIVLLTILDMELQSLEEKTMNGARTA